uniref:Transposase Tc1-like domain-containing protein n=1 Tax=Lates calcarifer TaxID=8187 RepID=A0A4W6C1J2_LATCA
MFQNCDTYARGRGALPALLYCFLTLSALRYLRLSSTDFQSRFAGRYGQRLSAQTIRNRLHAANLRSHRAARRPAMTALHHQARLGWCRQHVHWNLNMWRNVIFSDESRFCLWQMDRRVRILQPVAIPYVPSLGPNSILQDDNTHPPQSGDGMASSPDLIPTEHVWDQLGCAVRARVTNTTTLADLQQMLVEEWDAIPQWCVTRLVTSMRRRCQAVVAVYGSSTRY